MRSALSAQGPGHDVNVVVGAQGCSDIGLGGQALAWAERSGVGVGDVVSRRLSGGVCVWAGARGDGEKFGGLGAGRVYKMAWWIR
jgi:hypothetical protein